MQQNPSDLDQLGRILPWQHNYYTFQTNKHRSRYRSHHKQNIILEFSAKQNLNDLWVGQSQGWNQITLRQSHLNLRRKIPMFHIRPTIYHIHSRRIWFILRLKVKLVLTSWQIIKLVVFSKLLDWNRWKERHMPGFWSGWLECKLMPWGHVALQTVFNTGRLWYLTKALINKYQ